MNEIIKSIVELEELRRLSGVMAVGKIIKDVCKFYKVTPELIYEIHTHNNLGQKMKREQMSRKRELLMPRQVIIYFVRTLVNHRPSLSTTGNLCHCDHSTVCHSVRVVNNYIETDKKFRENMELLRSNLMNK
ncbi:MAG: helix-turn-helix domain-containing protein [Bacteroidota bacterium]